MCVYVPHYMEWVYSGYTSESDGEELCGGEGEVVLPQDLPGRANIKSEQSTVRLSEVMVLCGLSCGDSVCP